jgi:hypothetical protein
LKVQALLVPGAELEFCAVHKDEKWSMEKHQEEAPDPLAALPPVPAKTMFEAPEAQAYNAEARMPSVDSSKVSALSSACERDRLQTSLKAACAHQKLLRLLYTTLLACLGHCDGNNLLF